MVRWTYLTYIFSEATLQIIYGSSAKAGLSRRNLGIAFGLGFSGITLILLPVFGVITFQVDWLLIIIGVGLIFGAGWFGGQFWNYTSHNRSQKQLDANLATNLDNSFVYFRNLTLPDTKSVGEINGVLLGPHGALVIELANLNGEFICERDTWYKFNGGNKPNASDNLDKYRRRLTDSPTWHVIRAAREVKAWLSVRNLPQVPVQPVVVLAKGKVKSVKQPSCPIVELWYLETYLKSSLLTQANNTGTTPISKSSVEQIVTRLRQ